MIPLSSNSDSDKAQKSNNTFGFIAFAIFIILFFYIFISNFIYEFNDADDAVTLVYHFLGRDAGIQMAYNPYDSMSDMSVSFLPADYHVLFNTMMISTFLFTIIIILEIAYIVKIKLGIKKEYLYCIPLFLIAISPELIYLGLTFKTTILAFSFCFLSQILIITGSKYPDSKKNIFLFTSACTFSFGVSMRWDAIMFGIVIIYEIVLANSGNNKKKIFYDIFKWLVPAAIFTILFLYLSGYTIIDLISIARSGNALLNSDSRSVPLSSLILNATTFFTPAFVLLFLISLFLIIKNKNFQLLIFFIISFLPFLYLSLYQSPKYIMQLFPPLFSIVIYPLVFLKSSFSKKFLIASVLILILFNWFAGIRIYADNTVYGPGFSYKPEDVNYLTSEKSVDKRISIKKIEPAFSDGFMFPTSEGFRPLYGHFYVLISGKYLEFMKIQNNEYREIMDLAVKNIPILTDRVNPLILNMLAFNNYVTKTPWNKRDSSYNNFIIKRDFTKLQSNDPAISVIRFSDLKQLQDSNIFRSVFKNTDLILSFTYSSFLNQFLNEYNSFIEVVERISPYSCLVKVK